MRPIEMNHEFAGAIYQKKFNGYNDYVNDYVFLNGIRLEGLDSVFNILYYNNRFWCTDVEGYNYLYSTEGKFIYSFDRIMDDLTNGYYIVKKQTGYTLCDSAFRELVSDNYSVINSQSGYYIGSRDNKFEVISVYPNVIVSKPYKKMKHVSYGFVLGYVDEVTFDVYNKKGILVCSGGKVYEPYSGYFVVKTDTEEFWLNEKAEIYATRKL